MKKLSTAVLFSIFGLASKDVTYNNSILSIEPIPLKEEIMSDSQFKALEINKVNFIKLWDELLEKISNE